MSNRLFLQAGRRIGDGTIDLDTNTLKIVQLQLDGTLTDTAVKAITGCTTATPMVVTSTSHGFSNGDVVVQRGVGGIPEANGTFIVAGVTTNTYQLTNMDGANTVGVGTYTSGGCVINLTLAAFLADIDGARATNTTDSSALTTPTMLVGGVFDCDDVTLTATGAATIHACAVYKDTGVAGTSNLIYFIDGRTLVTVAKDSTAADTTLWVEKIEGILANASSGTFTNGRVATLTAQASAFTRSLTVSALANAIAAGHTCDLPTLNSALPITLGTAGTYQLQVDNGVNRLFRL